MVGYILCPLIETLMTIVGAFFSFGQIISVVMKNNNILNLFAKWYIWISFITISVINGWWTKLRCIKGTIPDKSVNLCIKFCSVVNKKRTIVVPINTKFDSSFFEKKTISSKSVQYAIIQKAFKGSCKEMDSMIVDSLKETYGDYKKEYPLGTVVHVNNKKYSLLFLADAIMSDRAVSKTTEEQIIQSLDGFWNYLDEFASNDTPIALPLLGTGQGRLSIKFTDIVHLIIMSYVTHIQNTKKIPIRELIICIPIQTVKKNYIDIKKLQIYMEYICNKPSVNHSYASQKL